MHSAAHTSRHPQVQNPAAGERGMGDRLSLLREKASESLTHCRTFCGHLLARSNSGIREQL